MSPEERQLLTSLFDRIRSAAATPRDAEAEALISQSVREQPYAPYFLSQAVILQEQGMKAAADRIQQLEAQVRELEQRDAGSHQPSQGGSFLGGLGSLFGSSQPAQPQRSAPPQAGYGQPQGRPYDDYSRPAPQPGPWGPQQPAGPWSQQPSMPSAGGSFLRGALGTAAGVAGGVMLAESLSSLFSPHLGGGLGSLAGLGGMGSSGSGAAAATPVEETVINNNYFGSDGNADNGNDAGDQTYVSDDSNDYDDYGDSSDTGDDDSFNV